MGLNKATFLNGDSSSLHQGCLGPLLRDAGVSRGKDSNPDLLYLFWQSGVTDEAQELVKHLHMFI